MSDSADFYNGGIIGELLAILYTNISKKERTAALMANPDAQREATARYNRKTYERVELRVKKGQKEVIQKAAKGAGKSLNRYILDLVAKDLGRDDI